MIDVIEATNRLSAENLVIVPVSRPLSVLQYNESIRMRHATFEGNVFYSRYYCFLVRLQTN